jgi:excisionase family DNA binding protein
MNELTIREASQLIRRTSATIRRYIRSGRLRARMEAGKFGEEYRIRRDDLAALGFAPGEAEGSGSALPVPVRTAALDRINMAVPVALYNELLMKHEQLLVQYGMIRAAGQKLLEYKAEAEARMEDLRRAEERYQRLRDRAVQEIGLLRKRLRQAEAGIEERRLEITLMQEKMKRLELAAAGAATHEGLETRIGAIRDKERTIAELSRGERSAAASGGDPAAGPAAPWRLEERPVPREEDH